MQPGNSIAHSQTSTHLSPTNKPTTNQPPIKNLPKYKNKEIYQKKNFAKATLKQMFYAYHNKEAFGKNGDYLYRPRQETYEAPRHFKI